MTMTVVSNPEDQTQYNEIIQEIKSISTEIQEDSESGDVRPWRLKMKFNMIRDLVWQAEALIKGGKGLTDDF